MGYLLWVELEGFYVDHHGVIDKPLVVSRDKLVLDANPLAKRRGIRLGMEVRQAKAVVNDCLVQEWEEECYLPRRKMWLDVCTDFTGIIEPLDQHIATLDLSGHPCPLDVTEKLVRELVSRTQLMVHYGAAPSVWIAKLAADHEDLGQAIESPAGFLSALPVKDLLPASEETRNRLSFLGYRTIGQVADIPLPVLQGQFGEEALTILSAAQGRHQQPVHPLYPLGSVHECLIFEGDVELQEAIDDALRLIADRIGNRLTHRSLQSSQLEIKLEMEQRIVAKSRRFTKPIHNSLSALIAMRLLIQDAIDAPVSSIRATLTDLEKTRHRQQELEGFTFLSKRPEASSAVSYVRTVFGENSIKLASQIQLPRRMRVLKEWQNATGWR